VILRDPPVSRPILRGSLGFWVIGTYKLVKATLLLAAGVLLLRTGKYDVVQELERLGDWLHLDRDSRFLHWAISRLSGLEEHRLAAIGAGTILYGLLYVAQSAGLLLRRRWGAYLVIVTTGFLIPVETYATIRRPDAPRISVLVLNLAIVAYLVVKLRQGRAAEVACAPTSESVGQTQIR
jgi:uncharacterized membrane protein (DUF2068 family)